MNTRGRPTTDKKGQCIRVRLNDETRNYIDRISKETGKSISEVIRDCIIREMYR